VLPDHQFGLEAVGVLQVGGAVSGAARVGVAFGEQERPAVRGCLLDERVEFGAAS
jgi:hypothetical protein